uniref:hypothetical protein n=1 Tax=Sphaerisporangium sp. CA-236357 TaxID=3240030 RepID=UPI003F491A4A
MPPTSPPSPATIAAVTGETHVLRLLHERRPVATISDATTWPAAAVRKLAARNGMLIDEHGVPYLADEAFYSERVNQVAQAEVSELLQLAEACPDARVRKASQAVTASVQALRDRLADYESTAAQRLAAESARVQAEADIARLTAELTQAKARLKDASGKTGRTPRQSATTKPAAKTSAGARRYQPGSDYDTSTARAWAKANGYADALPKSGRYVPDEVIDAMRAEQHPATPQSQAVA